MELTKFELDFLGRTGEHLRLKSILQEVRGHAITPERYFELCQEVGTLVDPDLARQFDLVFLLPSVSQDKAVLKTLSELKSGRFNELLIKSEPKSEDKPKARSRRSSKSKPKQEPDL